VRVCWSLGSPRPSACSSRVNQWPWCQAVRLSQPTTPMMTWSRFHLNLKRQLLITSRGKEGRTNTSSICQWKTKAYSNSRLAMKTESRGLLMKGQMRRNWITTGRGRRVLGTGTSVARSSKLRSNTSIIKKYLLLRLVLIVGTKANPTSATLCIRNPKKHTSTTQVTLVSPLKIAI